MPVEYNTLKLAVEGYPDKLSYQPGDEVAFHCSSQTPTFSVEIARIGIDRELVWQRQGIRGEAHPIPKHAYANGCDWPVTFTFAIPAAWRSGYYEVTFFNLDPVTCTRSSGCPPGGGQKTLR